MIEFCYDRKNDVRVLGVKTCLHYAQLYTLGDKYGIITLQAGALRGLTAILRKALSETPEKIEPEFVNDLLATITHIYQNTPQDDRMRKKVACFPWKSSTMVPYKDQCTEFLRDNPE